MKKAVLWAVLAIPILLNTNDPVPIWGLMGLAACLVLKKNAWIFIVLTLSLFCNPALARYLPPPPGSPIVELNDKSFIVSTNAGKVLVYTKTIENYGLLDEVTLKSIRPFEISPTTVGFDQKAYYRINNLIGTVSDEDITVSKTTGAMAFLNTGGFNTDPAFKLIARALLFQSDPMTDFITLVSLGLIYSIMMKAGRFVLSFIMNETWALIIMAGLMVMMGFVFAYPISLIRVILTVMLGHFIKNAKTRVILYVLFFMLYDQTVFKSIAVLYPLMFLVFSAFRPKKITQWGMLSLFQIGLFHQTALILIVIYPLMRKVLTVLIAMIWLSYGVPWFNPLIFFIHDHFQNLLSYLEKLMIIKGSLSMPLVLCLVLILVISPVLKKKTALLLWLLVFCVPLLSSPWAYQVTLISVGQGDAILLQAPFNQEVVLIDTGKESTYGQVSSFLNAQGISKLDALIVTHDDADHSANSERMKSDYNVMRSVIQPKDVDLNWFHLKSLKTSLKNPSDNQASLVYLFEIKDLMFLMMADADELTEADLIRQYPSLRADVLKVGHHGSSSSTSDVFLSKIQAKLALISVGYNAYGHPSFQTLERLKDHRVMVMTTRDEGDITIILSSFWNGLKTSSLNLKTLRLGF